MPRLASRQRFVPGGFKFYQPEIKWQAQANSSFDTIVWNLIAARNANPNMVQKYRWATDYNNVANEVDEFNAAHCVSMGWHEFVSPVGGQAAPPPFFQPMPPHNPTPQSDLSAAATRVKAIWSGVRTINGWKEAGYPAVPSEQSERRAAICAECPKNGSGGIEAWFTKTAAEVIRKQAEDFSSRGLTTTHDEKLNVCECCYCPMRLKVHTPIEYIKPNTAEDVLAKMRENPKCWIVAEMQA